MSRKRSSWGFTHHARRFTPALALLMLLLVFFPTTTAAQSIPGVSVTYYGYFVSDGSQGLMLGHLEADDPALAAELVSPRFAEQILDGFDFFSDSDFASDLDPEYIDAIDEADEYMVFAGTLDFWDGVKPGYVMLLSADQQVFTLVGYQVHADDLFGLAAETIREGAAPERYGDYTAIPLTSTDDLASGASQGDTASQTDTGNEFCQNEPSFAAFDENSDGVVTIAEFEVWSSAYPEIAELVATMQENGFDSVRYTGC